MKGNSQLSSAARWHAHRPRFWLREEAGRGLLPSVFQLFDLNRVLNDADFIAMLEELGMILPTDSKQDRKLLLGVCRDSIEALSRPFQYESFNFDDPSYVR